MAIGVPWTADSTHSPEAEGLRARKKREQRRQLSDTATRLFLERGFDGVRVAEIAEACGVSEATVYNYFPSKESLILDRLDGTASAFVQAVGDPDRDPVNAVIDALNEQLHHLLKSAPAGSDETPRLDSIHRFGALIRSTPSLRAHSSNRKETCTTLTAAALAERYQLDAYDPRMMIAAAALVGLWQLQSDSLFRATSIERRLDGVARRVQADLEAAAKLISRGLDSLSVTESGN
jgi:AcrR family transcriptional regulator